MGKDWEYSILTKTASENGGPEKYIESVAERSKKIGFNQGVRQGYQKGIKEGITQGFEEAAKTKDPVIALVAVLGAVGCCVTYHCTKKKTKEEAQKKQNLIVEEKKADYEELLKDFDSLNDEYIKLLEQIEKDSINALN